MRSAGVVPLWAGAVAARWLLAAGAIFAWINFPFGAGAWAQDWPRSQDAPQCESERGVDGSLMENNWHSIRQFVRTLMGALLLVVATAIAIAEIKAPGLVATLYVKPNRRKHHQEVAEKDYEGVNANIKSGARNEKKQLHRKAEVASTKRLHDTPILNIENAIALVGGWQSRSRHGAIREGVWFDKDGRAWKVAIKSPLDARNKACVQAINNECSTLTAMPHHPNIVWVIGGRMGEDPMIVEELMAMNLGQLLSEPGPGLTYREILSIGLDVARGMCHLHEHGYTHFDITPSSILLDEDRNAMLAGFSNSKYSDFATVCTVSEGTPEYMAPECQAGGTVCECTTGDSRFPQSDAEKIDVYSLGKVLLKCVTASLEEGNATAVRECPAPLWEFICGCLRPWPEDRPGCEQVVKGLSGMLEEDWGGSGDWRARRPKADIWAVSG